MYFALSRPQDRELALRNGGQVVATYPDGWLIDVEATRIGAVTFQLRDGSVLRLYAPSSAPSQGKHLDEKAKA